MTSAETAYLFRHALLRDAAYSLQPPAERAALHALALELLEARLTGAADIALGAAMAGELADHALLAAPGSADEAGLRRKELAHLVRAAGHAEAGFQHADAIRLHDRIAAHPQADAARIAESLLRSADLLRLMGRMPDAMARVPLALALNTDGNTRARTWIFQASLLNRMGQPEAAGAALRRAQDQLGDAGDPGLRGQALSTAALIEQLTGEPDRACALYPQALELLRATSAGQEPYVRVNFAMLLAARGELDAAESHLRAAMNSESETVRRRIRPMALANLATVHADRGQDAEHDECTQEALRLAHETGDTATEGQACGNLGDRYLELGRFTDAEMLLERSLFIARERSDTRAVGISLGRMAVLRWKQERFEDAAGLFLQARGLHDAARDSLFLGINLCARAAFEVERGHVPAAAELWSEGMALLRRLNNKSAIERRGQMMRDSCAKAGVSPLEERAP